VEIAGGLEAQFRLRNNFAPEDIMQYDERGCDSVPVIRDTRSTAEDLPQAGAARSENASSFCFDVDSVGLLFVCTCSERSAGCGDSADGLE
jgi:hypothetical protein